MEIKWLNKKNNNKFIVFFNGWGMDEKIVSNLLFEDYDVLTFFDYRNIEKIQIDLSDYKEKYLIAWSMGVYVCNFFRDEFKNFDKFIAINGTQKPIDNDYGIPVEIYNMTIERFNEQSCKKFIRKISPKLNTEEYCRRTIEELKEELISIRDLKIKDYLKFNKAFVSLKDRIIPAKNQINYWNQENIKITELDSNHYIFDDFKTWSELL